MIKKSYKWWNRIVSRPRSRWFGCVFQTVITAGLIVVLTVVPIQGAKSWFSKIRYIDKKTGAELRRLAEGDSSIAVFDVVISLYNDPSGDNNPDNEIGSEEQTAYENIIRNWADSVYEQSNGAHKLGKVRIFLNGKQSPIADVVWNESEWPIANVSGFGTDGQRIIFGDVFPDGWGPGNDYNMLTNPDGAGYTLGHEWGHYVYGLYDEYRGKNVLTWFTTPRSGDNPVDPSIMNSQWNAIGGNFEWLNHSTSDNYEAKTAQGRVYKKSGWEVLVQETSKDPRNGLRFVLPSRMHYNTLDGNEPTATDDWVKEELPNDQMIARDQLEIIWMQEDIEMQVVIDRSGSMGGTPIANAKQAAKTLVDIVQEGKTALGVISFSYYVAQNQPVTAIPDPGTTVKNTIKSAIDRISSGGLTAMFDAASLALTNLQAYQIANNTTANQVVFLLSDGRDNNSYETETSVTAMYQAADVPLITFGYGSIAPTGVLRRLADNTGGFFYSSPTTLNEIQSAFLAANAIVSESPSVASGSITVPSTGSAVSISFQVDSTLESLNIIVNYTGLPGDVNLTIQGPMGTVSGISFSCTAVAGSTSCIAHIDAVTVKSQGSGTWSVEAVSTKGWATDVNVDVVAIPSAERTYNVTVASLEGSTVTYPEPILLIATVSKGLPITDVNLIATVEDPNGDITIISMNDEGEYGDSNAGDGVYSVIIGYPAGDGIYTIEVQVDNSSGTAQFSTEGFQPAHPSPNVNGEMPETPTPPPITENFTRTAIVQVAVQGTWSDDHLDIAPGTTMYADNIDVAGTIDFAGDVDFFQINNVDTSNNLVVRISNFALGMDPILTVYMADGITAVAYGSLADATSARGYVCLIIEPANLDSSGTMIASVNHYDSVAAQGAYKISAGSTLASDLSSPSITTASATSVTNNSATLNGTVNPNGGNTEYYFEYGTSISYGSTTASNNAGSGTTDVSVSASITGLRASTNYHFRIVATNSSDTSYGNDSNFTTASTPREEEKGGDGCFIATAIYGSALHPHVKILRDFRDTYLMPNKLGSKLVNLYYKYSPSVANLIAKHKVLRIAVRINLLPIVVFSYSIVHFGPVITAVIFIFIFIFSIFLILFFRRKARRVEAIA